VGSNDLFISCHVLGSVDVDAVIHTCSWLAQISSFGSCACMHTTNHSGVCIWYVCTHSSIFFVVPLGVREREQEVCECIALRVVKDCGVATNLGSAICVGDVSHAHHKIHPPK
jgi:hypothetical protein